MTNESNTNKEVPSSLGGYTNAIHDTTNAALNTASEINKWYANELNKIINNEKFNTRLETNVDNSTEEIIEQEKYAKLETKVEDYDELQTIKLNKNKDSRIKTQSNNGLTTETDIDVEGEGDEKIVSTDGKTKTIKAPSRIATVIKGAKVVNNSANRIVGIGKNLSNAMNENGITSFQKSSSRIMTKPVKKVANKVTKKATNKLAKEGSKVAVKAGRQAVKQSTKLMVKLTKLIIKLIADTMKLILSMLPEMAPVIIIIIVIAAFCSFFGVGMSEDTKKQYEEYMISVQDEYDKTTVEFYNQGGIVDGTIEGKGMINWKAALSIVQMLNGELNFDNAEKELLNSFKKANLYETITDVTYTYEKEIEEIDENGNKTVKKETVSETKKVVNNPSLEDYINWCNNNFKEINKYKKKKKISYDNNQTKFTDEEIEQIKLLYSSNSFFDLFSSDFKSKYAYLSVSIGDEQIQAIYNEFLANAGTRYLMDHSNLSYDNCMDYYDCSSWVIHCLAHAGIARIPNTTAAGIYKDYCVPVDVNDRQPGDLIFLKDTYDTGNPGGISHIGIYMGELTINGETTEWVVDTGGNPVGVKIRKYDNGWWNGSHFYGFGRLKSNN